MFTEVGAWKSYDELEDSLSLDELYATIETIMENRRNDQHFLAALQGVDLGKENDKGETDVDEIKKRAARRLENEQRTMELIASGMTVEEARLESERQTEAKELSDLGLVASDGW